MHEQAAWHVDAQHHRQPAIRRCQFLLQQVGIQSRPDGIVANLHDPTLNGIQIVQRYAFHLAGAVVHAQHQRAAAAIGQSRQFVGEAIPMRRTHSSAAHANALEFQGRIFTKTDAPRQRRPAGVNRVSGRCVVNHGARPLQEQPSQTSSPSR